MKKIVLTTCLLFVACTQPNRDIELLGELIYRPQYVDDNSPHIRVAPEDIDKLPRQDKVDFYMPDFNLDLPAGSTIKITVKDIEYPMEGSPIITFSEIYNLDVQ